MKSYLNFPSSGGTFTGSGQTNFGNLSPQAGLVVGALPDGAANAFLKDRPSAGAGRRSGTREIASTRPAAPGSEFRPGQGVQSNVGSRPDQSTTRPANVAQLDQPGNRQLQPSDRDFVQNLPSRITDNEQREIWRHNIRDGVGEYLRVNADSDKLWFGDEWYLYHHLEDLYSPNYNYWSSAAWPSVTTWINYGLSKPVYYNYGDNVYYQNESVYYGDQPVATEQEYADQAEAIATNIPKQKPAAEDWMPLGVFAITPDGKPTGAEPNFFLQLAVSKQGVLSGSLQNTATNKVQSIEGMVDKQTQRAAWTATGKTRPLMETGIVNLTEETTPTLVHFADGTTQQWLLVRVDKSASGAESAKGAADGPK